MIRIYLDADILITAVTPKTLSEAARLRAERLSIKLPDSINLASARLANCHAFVSSDKRLMAPTGPPVIEPVPGCLELLRALAS